MLPFCRAFVRQVSIRSFCTRTARAGDVVTILGVETSCDDTCVSIVKGKLPDHMSSLAKRNHPNRNKDFDNNNNTAVRNVDGSVLVNLVSSQAEFHEFHYGGVKPGEAARLHSEAIDFMLDKALGEYQDRKEEFQCLFNDGNNNDNYNSSNDHGITHIAVTVGPGLDPCLWQGINAVKRWTSPGGPLEGVTVLPMNHLEGHILSARLQVYDVDESNKNEHTSHERPEFPFLSVLVSGGHCMTVSVRGVGQYEILGQTLDDSLGEALDKVARLLGVSGGGRGLEAIASQHDPADTSSPYRNIKMPIPMRLGGRREKRDMSFSGLKSHTARLVEAHARQHAAQSSSPHSTTNNDDGDDDGGSSSGAPSSPSGDDEFVVAVCNAFQETAFQHISEKVNLAVADHDAKIADLVNDTNSSIKSPIVICGGVAANRRLRSKLDDIAASHGRSISAPPISLCTDNAAMIAWSALERLSIGNPISPLEVIPDAVKNILDGDIDQSIAAWKAKPRWKLTDLS